MTSQKNVLLEQHDGRYYAIGDMGTGIGVLMKQERLGSGQYIDFALPSSPGLFLNAARRSYLQIKGEDPKLMFYKWQNARIPINQSKVFDYFESFASHVVFAFTALEAFANESIPKDYTYRTEKKGESVQLSKIEIERTISLDEKLDCILPDALGVASPKGKKPWQQYKMLKKMRDRIIHLKSVDQSSSGYEQKSVWGMMLRSHDEPFCDHAHAMMGYYLRTSNRRWHREYPYTVVEPDKLSGDK